MWAEAVRSAIYAFNRSINSSDQTKTPYEKWFGHKPNVSNLHEFGQGAIIYDTAQKAKFDERGKAVRFVGYTEVFNTFRFLQGKGLWWPSQILISLA